MVTATGSTQQGPAARGSSSSPSKAKKHQRGCEKRKIARERRVDWAPTRPLFLEMAEKLRAIADHRLRVLGYHEYEIHVQQSEEATDGSTVAVEEDEVGDENDGDGLWTDEVDEMDGEERSMSQSMIDEETESETESDVESEYWEESDDDVFMDPLADDTMELEATSTIIGTADKAEEYSRLILKTCKYGLLRARITKEKISGNTAWVYCRRAYCG